MSAWFENRLTERLGIRYPIIQAPMAGAIKPDLTIAAANAGVLGSLPAAMLSIDELRTQCAAVREATNGAFNVNFFTHKPPDEYAVDVSAMRARLAPYYEELGIGEVPNTQRTTPSFNDDQLEVLVAERPGVVSFQFGLPGDEAMNAIKETGAAILGLATNADEAKTLQDRGVDAVIAQGFEDGGHRGTVAPPYEAGQIGTFALVPLVADAVDIPVIAAGGIADGRGIAAALALGASAVLIGTAFLTCPESGAPDLYRQALLKAGSDETRMTDAFSGRPARGLENRYIREMADMGSDLPPFPVPNALTGPLRKASAAAGKTDFMSLWAGQAMPLARDLPVAEFVETLVRETDAAIAAISR